jgi:hypothetical protein
MAPLRMANLTRLDIERNLVRPGQGKALHIVIGAEEVKIASRSNIRFRRKASRWSSAISGSFDRI